MIQMMMPRQPGAGFVMSHPHLPFAFFQGGLDGPAHPTDADEFPRGARDGRITQIEWDLGLRAQCPLEDEPDPGGGQHIAHRRDTQKRELSDQGSFAAFFDRLPYPSQVWPMRQQIAHGLRWRSSARHARMQPRLAQEATARQFQRWGCNQTRVSDGGSMKAHLPGRSISSRKSRFLP